MIDLKNLYQGYGTYNIFYNQLNLPSPSVEYAWRKTKKLLHNEVLRLIAEILKTKSQVNICDIGCGNGGFLIRLSQELSDTRIKYLGIDISKPFVDFANSAVKVKNLKNTSFKLYDVETQKLPDTFDIVISSEVLEHLKNPQQFIQNVHRHLFEPGYLLLSTPNAKNAIKYPFFFLKNLVKNNNETELKKSLTISEETYKLAEEDQHIKTFSHEELNDLLKKNGLTPYQKPRSTAVFGGPFLDNHPFLFSLIILFDTIADFLPFPQLGWDCIVFSKK